jgi:YfiH family protein
MIRPAGFLGAAFGSAAEPDGRINEQARREVSSLLGISHEWAIINQVHGSVVIVAEGPGSFGDADAIVTTTAGLPVAVGTADCIPLVLEGRGIVAVAHAGWRGTIAGVVPATLATMERLGRPAQRAALGPAIGRCCYEVGAEVAARFPDHGAQTTWGTPSVDLGATVRAQLGDLAVWDAGVCTACSAGFHSHRRDGTPLRQVALAWL